LRFLEPSRIDAWIGRFVQVIEEHADERLLLGGTKCADLFLKLLQRSGLELQPTSGFGEAQIP
jgi:hypothetical protein